MSIFLTLLNLDICWTVKLCTSLAHWGQDFCSHPKKEGKNITFILEMMIAKAHTANKCLSGCSKSSLSNSKVHIINYCAMPEVLKSPSNWTLLSLLLGCSVLFAPPYFFVHTLDCVSSHSQHETFYSVSNVPWLFTLWNIVTCYCLCLEYLLSIFE